MKLANCADFTTITRSVNFLMRPRPLEPILISTLEHMWFVVFFSFPTQRNMHENLHSDSRMMVPFLSIQFKASCQKFRARVVLWGIFQPGEMMIRRGEEGDACHFDLWVVVSTSRMATISVIVLRCTGSPYSHRIDPHNDARRKAGVAQQNPSKNLISVIYRGRLRTPPPPPRTANAYTSLTTAASVSWILRRGSNAP